LRALVPSEPSGATIDFVVAEASERRRLLDEIERDLSGVSAAMERLDAGTYAQCEACGNPIGEDRLREAPFTMRCTACPSAAS
jgi:DnaK suppressor protein